MKKLFLLLVLSASTAHSQIVVKETTKDSTVWYSKLTGLPKLTHFYDAEKNWYTLYYKNLEYQYITDIHYIHLGSKESTVEFFNILKQAIVDKKELNFELDGKTWFLKTGSNMAYMSSSGTTFFLTNKNLDKILEALQ
jgi:hypothetical protein